MQSNWAFILFVGVVSLTELISIKWMFILCFMSLLEYVSFQWDFDKIMGCIILLFRKKKSKGKKQKKECSSSGSGSDNDVEVIKVWNSRSRGGGEGAVEDLTNNPSSTKSDEGEDNTEWWKHEAASFWKRQFERVVRNSAVWQNGRFLNSTLTAPATSNYVFILQKQGAST